MVNLITFDEAISNTAGMKRNLLLGNGFSIACEPDIFQYGSLYDRANFSNAPEINEVFKILGTFDFEKVIQTLQNSAKILPIYVKDNNELIKKLSTHASLLKDILVNTIASHHPERPGSIAEEKIQHCRKFLSYFISKDFGKDHGRIYTLNYDLLLYWVLMHDDVPQGSTPIELVRNDGFGDEDDTYGNDYVVWLAEGVNSSQSIHYLHGALHLFDAGVDIHKYTWSRSGIPLIDQIRAALERNFYPMFVAEGASDKKLEKIRHHAYLEHSYKSFTGVMALAKQALFIYGHSLAENDSHILKKIGKGKIPVVYISIYGDSDSEKNKAIYAKAESVSAMRSNRYPLEIRYFDAESARVWG